MNLLYYNYIRYERSPRAGAVVQLGERFPCTEEVAGSIPVSSTYVVVPEWLRGWIANPLFVGSIPTHHSKEMQNIFVFQEFYEYILLRWKSYRKDVLIPSKRCRFDSYPPLNFTGQQRLFTN